MQEASRRSRLSKPQALGLAGLLLLGLRSGPAQTLPGPDSGPSLGEIARQQRQRKGVTAVTSEQTRALVRDSLEAEETLEPAPVGFKHYRTAEYRLLVPETAELVAEDHQGKILRSSGLGAARAIVVVGDPMPIAGVGTYAILTSAAKTFLDLFPGASNGSSNATVDGRSARHVSFNGSKMGNPFWGAAVLVLGPEMVIPVACGYPPEDRELRPQPDSGRKTAAERAEALRRSMHSQDDQRQSSDTCQRVLSSVHLLETPPFQPTPRRESGRRAAPPSIARSDVPGSAVGEQPALGDLARKLAEDKAAQPKAKAVRELTDEGAAAGFESREIVYCEGAECLSAFFLVPSGALRVADARPRTDHVTARVGKGSADIWASGGQEAQPRVLMPQAQFLDYLQAEFLRDPLGNGSGPADVVLSEDTVVGEFPARRLRFRVRNAAGAVVGDQLQVLGTRRVQIACAAAEKDFADVEPVCRTVLDSLRVPRGTIGTGTLGKEAL